MCCSWSCGEYCGRRTCICSSRSWKRKDASLCNSKGQNSLCDACNDLHCAPMRSSVYVDLRDRYFQHQVYSIKGSWVCGSIHFSAFRALHMQRKYCVPRRSMHNALTVPLHPRLDSSRALPNVEVVLMGILVRKTYAPRIIDATPAHGTNHQDYKNSFKTKAKHLTRLEYTILDRNQISSTKCMMIFL